MAGTGSQRERARRPQEAPPTLAESSAGAVPTGVGLPVPVPGLLRGVVRRAGGAGADVLGGSVVDSATAQALARRRGRGQALPEPVASSLGGAFGGVDLSGVRVHADGEADRISRSLQATAFTAGSDVYFSAGTYAPSSASGQQLLAHELAHVVQQQTGLDTGGGGGGGPVVGRADDPAEARADAMADRALTSLRRQAALVPGPAAEPALGAAPGPWDPTAPVRRQASRVAAQPVPVVRRKGFFSEIWDRLKGRSPRRRAPRRPLSRPPPSRRPCPSRPASPSPLPR